jgi:protein O-mannosyl-transferase
MMFLRRLAASPLSWLLAGLLLTTAIYAPGVDGAWVFDDYPNIVDNAAVKPATASLGSLVNAAMSSPASEFKRPLASLSFALNYLATGMEPGPMKATNIAFHLLNGLAAYAFLAALFTAMGTARLTARRYAAVLAVAWMVLPIQLTAVLYVVQRMESMANLAVLLGLWGYLSGRMRMRRASGGFVLALLSIGVGTVLGLLAKETAVLLPLYAALIEIFVFRGRRTEEATSPIDRRIVGMFVIGLVLPLVIGMGWLLPQVLDAKRWETRDFTLGTRLLTEARVLVDYIGWTLTPTPRSLSFYHDDFVVSSGLLSPPTTLISLAFLAAWAAAIFLLRRRLPLVALGMALYLAGHVMTATVIPLELVYEHRNYFASLGLLIALAGCALAIGRQRPQRHGLAGFVACVAIVFWSGLTWVTAQAWGSPLGLAAELAHRGPESPRAQYELGRTYIIYGAYDPSSPLTAKAYAPLEKAASLPKASILPEQALIFMNSRMGKPVKDAWWESIDRKLAAHPASVQDESSLGALGSCLREKNCQFPPEKLTAAFLAALSHERASPRLKAMYADFAWNSLDDRRLAIEVQREVVEGAPSEVAYHIGLARMCIATGDHPCAQDQLRWMRNANLGGRFTADITALENRLASASTGSP